MEGQFRGGKATVTMEKCKSKCIPGLSFIHAPCLLQPGEPTCYSSWYLAVWSEGEVGVGS